MSDLTREAQNHQKSSRARNTKASCAKRDHLIVSDRPLDGGEEMMISVECKGSLYSVGGADGASTGAFLQSSSRGLARRGKIGTTARPSIFGPKILARLLSVLEEFHHSEVGAGVSASQPQDAHNNDTSLARHRGVVTERFFILGHVARYFLWRRLSEHCRFGRRHRIARLNWVST